jgi:hypothetical protein
MYNLNNLIEFNFSIENFDYEFKSDCTYTISNHIGTCWNLAFIIIFFMSDKTSKTIMDFFRKKKNYDQYINHITKVNNKFNLKVI